MSYYKKKHEAFESILKEMIELLPSSYNKEVDDTNYYKLLRALSAELADAEIEIKQIKDDAYLETVSPEAMYRNFGKLIALQKDPQWSDEKYRHLIKGVTQSLLKGPTKQSLIDGFKLFTNFKVNIYELFKDKDKLDPMIYYGYNPMFTFALEIEKPVDEYVDQKTLMRDANYIINIIKPAHTLTINIIVIVGEENYKKYYRIDRVIGKEIQDLFDLKVLAKINEKLMQRFFDESRDYSEENNVDFSEAVDILRNISNGMNQASYDQLVREISEKLLQNYNQSSTNCTPVRLRTIEDFIEIARKQTRGSLELKYYKELKDEVFNNANVSLPKEVIHAKIIEKQEELIKVWEDAGHNRFDKSDEEWFNEALDTLKEEYLRDFIVNELGGKEKLWQECSDIVEPYRIILEQNMENTAPYCGMDQMEVEASLTNTEGIFGWRSVDYDLQLKTSLNGNESRIGGARLIGPRYVLNDISNADIYLQHSDEIVPKFINGNKRIFISNHSKTESDDLLSNEDHDPSAVLQNYGEEHHIYFHQNNFEIVPIPCEHNTSMHYELSENPFETPEDNSHFYLHQSFHEFAWFLKGGAGLILNDGILNDHSTYFSDEPDHIEEMHVDWVSELYNTPEEEVFADFVMGVTTEDWQLQNPVQDESNIFLEQELSETTNFLKGSPLLRLNNSRLGKDRLAGGHEPDIFFIDIDIEHNETINNVVESVEVIIERSLTEKYDAPIEDISSISELDNSEQYDLSNKPYFELNNSLLNDGYLNGFEVDESYVKMYKVINDTEVIIREEAI